MINSAVTMMTRQIKFILAVALQVIIIFAIIILKYSVFAGGTEVFLKIAPVDPRDLLRGDYIAFQYDISNLNSYYSGGQQIRNGDAVYVVLRQTGKYWTAQNVQKIKPTNDELFIKGMVEYGGTESQADQSHRNLGNSRLHVVYGIEQYFIPEGEGKNFSFGNKEAAAIVAVDDSGNAVLKRIYVDNKPWPDIGHVFIPKKTIMQDQEKVNEKDYMKETEEEKISDDPRYLGWLDVAGKAGGLKISMKHPETWISYCSNAEACYVSNIQPNGSFEYNKNLCLFGYLDWDSYKNNLKRLRINNMVSPEDRMDCDQKLQLIEDSQKNIPAYDIICFDKQQISNNVISYDWFKTLKNSMKAGHSMNYMCFNGENNKAVYSEIDDKNHLLIGIYDIATDNLERSLNNQIESNEVCPNIIKSWDKDDFVLFRCNKEGSTNVYEFDTQKNIIKRIGYAYNKPDWVGDEIAVWQTFKNNDYGYPFGFKYPDEYSIDSGQRINKLFDPNHEGKAVYDISDNEGNKAWVELADINDFKWHYVHGSEKNYFYLDVEARKLIDKFNNATEMPKTNISKSVYKLRSGCCDGSTTNEYLIVDYDKNKILIVGYNDDGKHDDVEKFKKFIINIDMLVSSIY